MKKEKELDVLDKLIEDDFKEEDRKKLDWKLLFSQIIVAVIILILLIISFVNTRRSVLFSYLVFNNTAIIPMFLFTTLIIGFIYTLSVIMVYVIARKEIGTLKSLVKIYKKLDLVRFVDFLLGFAFFVIVFVITPCNVIGDSMNDTLTSGDRVMTTDLFYGEPNVGDIITFDCSNYVKSDTMLYIKRVIAKNGSKIEYDATNLTISVDGKVEVYDINSIEYARIYLTANDICNVFDLTIEMLTKSYDKSFVMPKGKVLVFGDNRGNSRDSEEFGAISTSDIFGHVLFRFGEKISTKIIY